MLWSRPKACDCVSQSTELSGGRSDLRGGGMPVKKASIFFACSQGLRLNVELPMDLPSLLETHELPAEGLAEGARRRARRRHFVRFI